MSWKWLLVVLVLLGAFILWSSESDHTLNWKSDDGSIHVRVSATRPDSVGRSRSTLEVTHDSVKTSVQMDDDAHLGMVHIVRYEDWLLVASDDLIFGGYNTRTRQLVGEYCWGSLPFTVWEGGGMILMSRRFEKRTLSPAGFQYRKESTR